MPELPEVETTRRSVEPDLIDAVVVGASVRRPRMLRRQPHARDFADRLVGRRIDRVGRHGKFLKTELEGDITWVTHLGMSGRVSLARAGDPEVPHTNVVVGLDSGVEFRLIDPRTFGFVAAYTPEDLAFSSLAALGPDALDALPSSVVLQTALQHRSAPIKPTLLDQRILAGLGNIYADEALSLAGIAPQRPAQSLDRHDVVRLRKAIKGTLDAGLRYGGTSLDDLAYLLPDGRAGEYVKRLRVYGREDEPCRTCGTPIRREVLRQRSTHWCPRCQS